MLHRGVEKSARVCTVSEAAKRQIVAATACAPEKIVVAPNGIDRVYFEPHQPDRAHGRYFLCVGNDKPHKNLDGLMLAFETVRREEPALNLVMTGAPFDRFRGRPGVLLAGFVTPGHLASLYRGAIALVIPSLEEGFGLPAAEAMACGTAVITSDAEALVEITADASLHVDARSPESLAAAMLRVASDEVLRSCLAAAGRERARLFTWERCATETRAVYRTVLGTL
jgi:glycosyltransferase involved in cell wall biosynthesis